MRFTFLAAAAVSPVVSVRPAYTSSVRHANFARLRDLTRTVSSEDHGALRAVADLVDSIMLQEGNSTDHLQPSDMDLLREVIAMLEESMYGSMTNAQTIDAQALDDAIDAINQCHIDVTHRIEEGDIYDLGGQARRYQAELVEYQAAVDEYTLANVTAWNNLIIHIGLISDAPECPDFPNPRTMVAFDVYFAGSAYVTWWTAQQPAYYAVRDAWHQVYLLLQEALRAYAVGLGVRNTAYCFWKYENEVACAEYRRCYEEKVAHYLNVVKPGVDRRMIMRIEAYKAGETIIHQIKFLLGEEADQATPAIATDRYQMAFPDVPAMQVCDMSALDDPMWVPTPECAERCDETVDVGHRQDGYRGCQTHTRSGRLCQAWTENSPRNSASWARMEGGESQRFPDKGLGDHNFCRNPDHEPEGIWCWATGDGSSWEYCNPLDGPLPPQPPPTTQPPTLPPPTAPPTAPPTTDRDFPAGLLTCTAGPAALQTSCSANLDQLNQDIRASVTAHYRSLPNDCDDNGCPKGDLAGCLVRLAGHDVMDFNPDLNNHGSDGCIDFADPDNMGLHGCLLRDFHERDSSNVSLELMWQEFCTEVSAADFFVLAAEVMMAATTPTGPHQDKWTNSFASNFRFGRRTATECTPEPLPNPIHSCDAVREVFIDRMGLTWTQSAALMGVHTLGRALPENSGYDGFWVSQQHAKSWTPEYYNRIIGVGWGPETTSAGKMQWKRLDNALQGEMMLNTDMCLAYQSGGEAPLTRAEDGNHSGCCLWKSASDSDMDDILCNCQANDVSEGCTFSNCCATGGGCPNNNPFRRFMDSDRSAGSVESWDAVIKYARTTGGFDAWHDDFIPTWTQVTTQGVDGLC